MKCWEGDEKETPGTSLVRALEGVKQEGVVR